MTVRDEFEPLLARVQQPARYIGCEDGAIIPVHGPDEAAWLLAHPDTSEITAHLVTQPRGLRDGELIAVLRPHWRRPGASRKSMDAARRPPLRTPRGLAGAHVGAARTDACVMRRDSTHDRRRLRDTTRAGPTANRRTGDG